jgi:simple sugar transport system substrate-binding protein
LKRKLPGAKMIYLDKVNPADRPGTTPDQLAEDLVAGPGRQGHHLQLG